MVAPHVWRDYQGNPVDFPPFILPDSPGSGSFPQLSSPASYRTTDRSSSPANATDEDDEVSSPAESAALNRPTPGFISSQLAHRRVSDAVTQITTSRAHQDAAFEAGRLLTEAAIREVLADDAAPTPLTYPSSFIHHHDSANRSQRPRRRYPYHPADHITPAAVAAHRISLLDDNPFEPYSSSP
ncbi:hypothetical protein P7C70_g9273, partial [Phenoliferia sp. Uapishka_3]